jgi:FkbM family methyltransferase
MFQQHHIWFPNGDGEQFRHYRLDEDGVWTYQHHKFKHAMQHCLKFEVAVDAGAHIGMWSRMLIKRFQHILAFEPVPEYCECFGQNVRSPNVQLFKMALGANPGKCILCAKPSDSLTTHIFENGGLVDSDSHLIHSEMITLDSLSLPALDFFKLDCEGYEYQILLGAINTLKRYHPTVIVEAKGNDLRYGLKEKAALKLLTKLGAEHIWSHNGDYVMVWR